MPDTTIATAEDVIRRAIADPGTHTPRGDNYGEPLPSWQARGVLAALEAHGLTVVDKAAVDAKTLARQLLDSIEDGHLPGSPLRYRGEEIWLHTTGQVEGWLRTHLEKAGMVEATQDEEW